VSDRPQANGGEGCFEKSEGALILRSERWQAQKDAGWKGGRAVQRKRGWKHCEGQLIGGWKGVSKESQRQRRCEAASDQALRVRGGLQQKTELITMSE